MPGPDSVGESSLFIVSTLSRYDGGGGGAPLTGELAPEDWYSVKDGGGARLRASAGAAVNGSP